MEGEGKISRLTTGLGCPLIPWERDIGTMEYNLGKKNPIRTITAQRKPVPTT